MTCNLNPGVPICCIRIGIHEYFTNNCLDVPKHIIYLNKMYFPHIYEKINEEIIKYAKKFKCVFGELDATINWLM